jgi:hypothetical protein
MPTQEPYSIFYDLQTSCLVEFKLPSMSFYLETCNMPENKVYENIPPPPRSRAGAYITATPTSLYVTQMVTVNG